LVRLTTINTQVVKSLRISRLIRLPRLLVNSLILPTCEV
jgi:hypothetical protein